MNQSLTISEQKHRLLVRLFFAAWLLAWLYRLQSHVLLHQMEAPVWFNAHVDVVYWLVHLLQLPQLVTTNYFLAAILDALLLIIPILGLIRPQNRLYAILFAVFFLPYYFAFNTFGLKHTHCLTGFLLVPIAFWPQNGRGRQLVWEGLRYYSCWIFVSAFLWKLKRGYFFAYAHGQAILQSTRADYLAEHSETTLGRFLLWLLSCPDLLYAMMVCGGLLQGVFLIGFFTKRFDKWLVMLTVVFHLSNYFLFDIVFFELLVLCLGYWAVGDEVG
jgi:hypothetical protein